MIRTASTRVVRISACASLLVGAACDQAPTVRAPSAVTAVAAGPRRAGPVLPLSTSMTSAPSDALLVVLSREGLSLGKDGPILATADVDPAGCLDGFGAKYKRGSCHDLYLVPLGAALQAATPAQASAPPTVTIAADASIPYRMLHETLYTLGQARVTMGNLLVRSGLAIPFTFDASPLADQVRRTREALVPGAPIQLRLNVLVTTRMTPGFVVSAVGRSMRAGCREAGEGAAVPNPGNLAEVYLFAGLTACATTIKSSEPRFSTERHVTITADASVTMQTLVTTIDALRGADGLLFPEVILGLPM
jgi:biopolymer transport protein ExbD